MFIAFVYSDNLVNGSHTRLALSSMFAYLNLGSQKNREQRLVSSAHSIKSCHVCCLQGVEIDFHLDEN